MKKLLPPFEYIISIIGTIFVWIICGLLTDTFEKQLVATSVIVGGVAGIMFLASAISWFSVWYENWRNR